MSSVELARVLLRIEKHIARLDDKLIALKAERQRLLEAIGKEG